MPLERGFKAAAKRLALAVRDELGVATFAPLDPYALAQLYGIEVFDLSAPWLPPRAVRHFTGPAVDAFSGAVLTVGPATVILENHAHDGTRRRSTVAHEMAHVLLEHDFGVLVTEGGVCRPTSALTSARTLELEATELSGELLLPCTAARAAALRGWTDASVARYFRVSERLARWRMNVTGSRRVARRARAKWPRALPHPAAPASGE